MAYDIENPMAPPWLMYPHISRYSIGWRMGYGEHYVMHFGKWFSALTPEERDTFRHMFPAPKGWLGWYEEEYADEDCYDEDGDLLWHADGKPAYSLEWVQDNFRKGSKDEYLFFWGHQPSPDGAIAKTCLSQWWKAEFDIEIDTYCCMEQFMMAEKARLFGDGEMLENILKSDNPKEIKELGRSVSGFHEDQWASKRYAVVLNGNFAKFFQNEPLMQFLLQTGDKVLVEASPYDTIWGIGMSADDKDINNPFEWKGQNLLGFALMEVRDELDRICQHYSKLKLQELHREFG
ncbi:NADAR family protein [Paenibacillus sp. MBLB4367]|uniref:NADAR family protein n=1 Tax=Paenibacillus sp. MBLB4367 TaxID=3384767 RepID=UPI003908143F